MNAYTISISILLCNVLQYSGYSQASISRKQWKRKRGKREKQQWTHCHKKVLLNFIHGGISHILSFAALSLFSVCISSFCSPGSISKWISLLIFLPFSVLTWVKVKVWESVENWSVCSKINLKKQKNRHFWGIVMFVCTHTNGFIGTIRPNANSDRAETFTWFF